MAAVTERKAREEEHRLLLLTLQVRAIIRFVSGTAQSGEVIKVLQEEALKVDFTPDRLFYVEPEVPAYEQIAAQFDQGLRGGNK